jgi:hypothetical protein
MNPATILISLFDWRGVLNKAAYRRNLSILVLVNLLISRLDLLSGPASWGWTALGAAMGLSFDARRYHDMGRSAAWIAWANLISAALVILVFQFIPNVVDYIPLPADWRMDAAGQAVFGRFVLPAFVGVIVGNIIQSLWLASAPSLTTANSYAARAPARRASSEDDDEPDEAALQAIIDRHLAAEQTGPVRTVSANASRPNSVQGAPRQFGRRER